MLGALFDAEPAKAPRQDDAACHVTAFHFGKFLLCQTYIDAGRFARTRTRALQDDLDHLVVHLILRGGMCFGLEAGPIRLRAMDMALCDLSRDTVVGCRRVEAISLIFPRTELELHDRFSGFEHGQHLPRATPAAIVLASHLIALGELARGLGDNEAAALSGITRDMVLTCFGLGRRAPRETPHGAPVPAPSRRARHYIERHLQRPELGPADLERDLGISRTQLYRQFSRFGGVGNYIRQRRLRHGYAQICDPLSAHRRIGEIAYAVGFSDEAYFSRAFHQAFGLSPRAARAHSKERAGPSDASTDPASLAHWVRDLV
ncbi:helix-turn-helix domain-containing protein [Roseateles chitinivorans]|uniref:helix-turn-helix domain-containing protein n=1 Tax=Roseateles chitinivorans TaxID=2917965 RepID=UPI003D67EAC0